MRKGAEEEAEEGEGEGGILYAMDPSLSRLIRFYSRNTCIKC